MPCDAVLLEIKRVQYRLSQNPGVHTGWKSTAYPALHRWPLLSKWERVNMLLHKDSVCIWNQELKHSWSLLVLLSLSACTHLTAILKCRDSLCSIDWMGLDSLVCSTFPASSYCANWFISFALNCLCLYLQAFCLCTLSSLGTWWLAHKSQATMDLLHLCLISTLRMCGMSAVGSW